MVGLPSFNNIGSKRKQPLGYNRLKSTVVIQQFVAFEMFYCSYQTPNLSKKRYVIVEQPLDYRA